MENNKDLNSKEYFEDLGELVSKPFDPVTLKDFVRDHSDYLSPEMAKEMIAKENNDPILELIYDKMKVSLKVIGEPNPYN